MISNQRRAARLTVAHHALQNGYIPTDIEITEGRAGPIVIKWRGKDGDVHEYPLDPLFSKTDYLADGEWAVTITKEQLEAHAAWEKMSLELPILSERPEDEQLAWHREFGRLADVRSPAFDQTDG